MKKVSKFLSMFLLVALCFSLFSTAAYASGDDLLSLVDEDSALSAASQEELDSKTYPWKILGSDTKYESFYDAYAAASTGATIQMVSEASIGTDNSGNNITITGKNITIDLKGNTLTMNNYININAYVTLTNGYVVNPGYIQVIGGTLTVSAVKVGDSAAVESDFSKSSGGKVVVSTDVPSSAAVAKIGSVYYTDINDAFAAAAAASDQSVTLELTQSGWKYTVEKFPTDWKCSSLTLNIGNNVLDVGTADFKTTTLTVNGTGTLKGTITVNRTATLNVSKVDGTVTVNGATLNVNGSTINKVVLNNASTLNVPSSYGATIKALTLDESKNVLNVNAGTFGGTTAIEFPATHGTAGITNGIWYVDDTTQQNVTNFEANIKSGYSAVKENSYYKVGTGSTGSGATGSSSTVVNSSSTTTTTSGSYTYTATTSGDVAVWPVSTATWTSGDGNLYFYYTPNTAAAQGLTYKFYLDTTSWQLPGDEYTDNLTGTMSIGKARLAELSDGVHTLYLQVTESGVVYEASCTFYVSASLKAVDTDKHVINSTKTLTFVCSQPISRIWIGGTEITGNTDYYSLSSTRKTITLSADFLNARTAGSTYTITVQTDNGDQPSTTFQILTTAQASSSPKTGDSSNLALWAAVLVLTGGAAIAVLPRLKKNLF